MATLGALWSQQLGFAITTTAGTTYTHGLGYTPTVIILTKNGSPAPVAASPWAPNYTAANTSTVLITGDGSSGANWQCDVTVGSFHSLIK
jgi:hypothetical protein